MRVPEPLRRALRELSRRASLPRTLSTRRLRAGLRALARSAWLRHAPRTFLLHAQPSSHELGLAGEELAARTLRASGFRLHGRRLHTPHAEVDLWAERDDISWAIEVKTGRCSRLPALRGGPGPRWDLRWRPALSLSPEQRHRLFRAARYLGRRCDRDHGVLLIEVLLDPRSRTLEVCAPVRMGYEPPPRGESGAGVS